MLKYYFWLLLVCMMVDDMAVVARDNVDVVCGQFVQSNIREEMCSSSFLFVGGFHHSGTTLAHHLLAGETDDFMKLNAPKYEGEGGHYQHVFKIFHERKTSFICGGNFTTKGLVRSVSKYMCPGLMNLVSNQLNSESNSSTNDEQFGMLIKAHTERAESNRLKLFKEWNSIWPKTNHKVTFIEKDPDFGSMFLKSSLFPNVSFLLFIMRHPYTSTLSFETSCKDSKICLKLWINIWSETLLRLSYDKIEGRDSLSYIKHKYAIARYEDIVYNPKQFIDNVKEIINNNLMSSKDRILSDKIISFYSNNNENNENNDNDDTSSRTTRRQLFGFKKPLRKNEDTDQVSLDYCWPKSAVSVHQKCFSSPISSMKSSTSLSCMEHCQSMEPYVYILGKYGLGISHDVNPCQPSKVYNNLLYSYLKPPETSQVLKALMALKPGRHE